MGMFVEEDVVARHICGDPQRQVFQLRRLGVAQPNQLLLGVDFLQGGEKETVVNVLCLVWTLAIFCLIINNSLTQVVLSASMFQLLVQCFKTCQQY